MKAALTMALSVALVALMAGAASAQKEVNLRVHLSTQPVYGGWQSRVTYFGLGNLYSSGNVRGGRAFRGNRNFLEDRYFSGSMTGFYRDSVGVGDVTGRGPSYGLGQPFYRPGSLTTTGSNVRRYVGGTAPVGLSYNPQRVLTSPFQTTVYSRAVEPSELPSATYPSAGAIRGLKFKLGLTSASVTEDMLSLGTEDADTSDPRVPMLPQALTSDNLYMSPDEKRLDSLLPDWLRKDEPAVKDPEDANKTGWEIEPGDPSQQEYAEGAEQSPADSRKPLLGRIDLGQFGQGFDDDEDDMEPAAVPLPEMVARGRMRTRGSYAQYMELGRLELKVGAYRPAANAYGQAAIYQPMNQGQANLGEAVARLIIKEYFVASLMWRRAITSRPKAFSKAWRLTEMAGDEQLWKEVEEHLRKTIKQGPGNSDYALCLATLLVFSGRGAEAGPHLDVAEKDRDSAETVRLLRQWAAP